MNYCILKSNVHGKHRKIMEAKRKKLELWDLDSTMITL